MNSPLLVFDKDGVIIDSEKVKLKAIEDVFSDHPEQAERIRTYNHETIGIPRAVKFAHICEHILRLPHPQAAARRISEAFTARVDELLLEVPLVPGIRAYLEARPERKFVCSAAPLAEVEQNLATHGLREHFEEVYAFPQPKAEVLRALRQRFQAEIVFWGDTLADYRAAQEADVCFIGLTTARVNPFASLDIPTIPHFERGPDPLAALAHFRKHR